MKIGILVPLKARCISNDWEVTCRNLELTVASILNQSCSSYHAVVVGHDCPQFMKEKNLDGRCEFLKFDEYQPPEIGDDKSENQLRFEFDRCNKILKGMIFLSKINSGITHWFALDADDLLHKDFVSIVQDYEDSDAIILDHGYFYFKSTGLINVENEFSAYCGSSAIISSKIFDVPIDLSDSAFRKMPFGAISHVHMRQKLISDGYCVSIPNERIIMYVRENGENISNSSSGHNLYVQFKKYAKMLLRVKYVDEKTRNSFGLGL